MRRTSRILLAAMSILAVIPLFMTLLVYLKNQDVVNFNRNILENLPGGIRQIFIVALILALILCCLAALLYSIFGARLKKSRSKSNDIGTIDIGVGAIENIALNAAKAAQAGIKNAKAHVYAAPDDQVEVELAVVLYSDVEIPLQMAKIQERVKKDVEKYTGIGVANVKVKVTRVELIGTRVEH